MIRYILFFIASVVAYISVNAQTTNYSVDVKISGRVDTSNIEVQKIYKLFKDYLESRPDSIYDNPYWNSREKQLDINGNPALFYTPFYNLQMTPFEIFSYWKPFILSIVKAGVDKYKLRIAFIKDADDPDKIITIINLNAIKENNNWVLQNTISDIMESWHSKNFGKIRYYFPHTYQFNGSMALMASNFCDSIVNLLNLNYSDTCTFFICNNPDEMGSLLGYEYFYLNYTTGITNKWLKQIYSAKGNEYYPHELVHILLGTNNTKISYVIEEGIASFLGEYRTPKYTTQIKKVAKDYFNNTPTYSLDNLLDNKTKYMGYQAEYGTGSIIVEIVFDYAGYNGVKLLYESNTSNLKEIYTSLQRITGLKQKQLERIFENKLKSYMTE